MRLIAARLQRLRQHRELELAFGDGFSLVGGANESGKSTVVEALHKALFLKATATGRGVDELRSQLYSGLPEVELRFAATGRDWVLRKRFAGASGTCQLSGSGGETLQGNSAERQLAALLQVAGPIEGRRIAQLPLRWAHLWVRQGSAQEDLLASGGEAYDLPLLVQQLQHGDGSTARGATAAALESPLDRQVQQLLQQRLELQLTATGKVRAGSPLAQAQALEAAAQQALQQAEQRLSQWQGSMAQLQQIRLRLQQIEPLRQQLRAAEPLQRRLQQLQKQRQQWLALSQQRHNDAQQLEQLQQELLRDQQQLQTTTTALSSNQQQQQALEQRQQALGLTLERLSLQRDLDALEREATQLQAHKSQFDTLQQQASAIKLALQGLPAIDAAQVRQLRQAEQQLAQAQARCQGMAAQLELLSATADAPPVSLDGQRLRPGQEVLLEQPAVLQVGKALRLRISPGGGRAIEEANGQRQQALERLQDLRQRLGQADSDAAEQLAQQRQKLDGELAALRQAASTIPWAQLDQQLAAIAPRRSRLLAALSRLEPSSGGAVEPIGSDPAETLLAQQHAMRQQLQRLGSDRRLLEQQREQLNQRLQRHQGEAGRLQGAISATSAQLEQLQQQGDPEQLHSEIETLIAQLPPGGVQADGAQQLQRLEAEQESLLTSLGQQEQLCSSLGAQDPSAELEQRQAAWEQARAECDALSRSTAALQRLLRTFHQAQQRSADHYCLPLQQALRGYLEALALEEVGEPLLAYDAQQGFGDLRLQRSSASFGFGQLSGGMREQLGAALRLALAEVLLGAYDGCLPLVFDDAFSNCDPERLAGVLRMLARGVERGLQIVLLSCSPADYTPLLAQLGSKAQQIVLGPDTAPQR